MQPGNTSWKDQIMWSGNLLWISAPVLSLWLSSLSMQSVQRTNIYFGITFALYCIGFPTILFIYSFIHALKNILPFCYWILLSRNRNTAESLKSKVQLWLIKSSWHGDSLCPSCVSINSPIKRPASAIFDSRCFSPHSLILGFTPVGSQHLLSLDFLFLAQLGRGTLWGVVDRLTITMVKAEVGHEDSVSREDMRECLASVSLENYWKIKVHDRLLWKL